MQAEVEDLFQGYAVNSEKDGIGTQAAKFHDTYSNTTYDIAFPLQLFIIIPTLCLKMAVRGLRRHLLKCTFRGRYSIRHKKLLTLESDLFIRALKTPTKRERV